MLKPSQRARKTLKDDLGLEMLLNNHYHYRHLGDGRMKGRFNQDKAAGAGIGRPLRTVQR
jgi:hypothetical protein